MRSRSPRFFDHNSAIDVDIPTPHNSSYLSTIQGSYMTGGTMIEHISPHNTKRKFEDEMSLDIPPAIKRGRF